MRWAKRLAHLKKIGMTWSLDLEAFLRELTQKAPVAGIASDGTAETIGSSEGGTGDASSTQAGSGRAAHELSANWRRHLETVRGRTRGQSQRLEGKQPIGHKLRMNPEVANGLLAAAYE